MNEGTVIYNFVVPDDSGLSLEELDRAQIAELSHLIRRGGRYSWTVQTHHYLKQSGLPVKMSYELEPDCINFAHGTYLRDTHGLRWNHFTVCLQGDYPHFPLAQYHIVQNMAQESTNASYLPFWSQIGQIPRDPERNTVEVVAFQGRMDFTDLDSERLNEDLNPHGIRFEPLEEWQDLSGIDVLVGIRHYGRKKYLRKPASKLVNAWHANIPLVGGWDSAYAHIGTPGENYLRVASHDELVEKIIELKRDPELYNRLVRNGAERGKEFTPEAVARAWVDVMENMICPVYLAWRSKPTRSMLVYRWLSFHYLFSMALKKWARSTYRIPLIKRIRDLYYDPVK